MRFRFPPDYPEKEKVNPMRKVSSIIVLSLLISNVIGVLGQSPATSSVQNSAEVERRVESILSQMTLEEKIDLLGGVNDFFVRDVPRLKLPALKMADGPIGVRNFGPATAMAGGIGLAATWNLSRANERKKL
jgi:beta-glucosidase